MPNLNKKRSPKSRFRFPMLSVAWICSLTLSLSACSDKDDGRQEPADTSEGSGDGSGDGSVVPVNQEPSCVDDATYFSERVWAPVLQSQCMNCHNSSGVGKDSKLVLVGSEWGPTYHDKNRESLKEVALTQRDGQSILLLKPLGELSHGGGTVLEKDSEGFKALQGFVQRLDNPVTCADSPANNGSAYKGMELLSLAQTFRKASLSLAGRLPSAKELAALESGDERELDAALNTLLNEEAFYERLIVLFNDHFLTDQYLRGQSALDLLDNEDYPQVRWFSEIEDDRHRGRMRSETNRSVAREALELIVYIVRNHRSFEEVITADYTVVNPYSARVYGVEPEFINPLNPKEFVKAQIPGIPHAGVLTSSMFMNRFPTTNTNRNRHRSKMVYRFFLATDLEALASRPLDPTQIADHNPTLNSPSCTVCHTNMDPVAGALQNWDARGRYRPLKDGWFPDMISPGFNDKVMPPSEATRGASWLAKQIVQDKRFAISIVQMVHQMLTGHAPLSEPQDPDAKDYAGAKLAFKTQSKEFSVIADQFAANGFEIRDVFKALIKSPAYRSTLQTSLSPEQSQMFGKMANTRLLTPEQLNAKIEATLGYPWRLNQRDPDFLLSSRWFSIFYGGIDSEGVVQRITEPNGIMANIIQRMANEMACWSAGRDFSLDKEERRLFPHVERSFVPTDENGFAVPHAQSAIRKNIVHLHERLFGVKHDENHPEIGRAYKLFVDVWTDGQKKMADESYPNHLPWSCQSRKDFWTGEDLPKDSQITQDKEFTVRAWIAVLNYLLTDYRFLHE